MSLQAASARADDVPRTPSTVKEFEVFLWVPNALGRQSAAAQGVVKHLGSDSLTNETLQKVLKGSSDASFRVPTTGISGSWRPRRCLVNPFTRSIQIFKFTGDARFDIPVSEVVALTNIVIPKEKPVALPAIPNNGGVAQAVTGKVGAPTMHLSGAVGIRVEATAGRRMLMLCLTAEAADRLNVSVSGLLGSHLETDLFKEESSVELPLEPLEGDLDGQRSFIAPIAAEDAEVSLTAVASQRDDNTYVPVIPQRPDTREYVAAFQDEKKQQLEGVPTLTVMFRDPRIGGTPTTWRVRISKGFKHHIKFLNVGTEELQKRKRDRTAQALLLLAGIQYHWGSQDMLDISRVQLRIPEAHKPELKITEFNRVGIQRELIMVLGNVTDRDKWKGFLLARGAKYIETAVDIRSRLVEQMQEIKSETVDIKADAAAVLAANNPTALQMVSSFASTIPKARRRSRSAQPNLLNSERFHVDAEDSSDDEPEETLEGVSALLSSPSWRSKSADGQREVHSVDPAAHPSSPHSEGRFRAAVLAAMQQSKKTPRSEKQLRKGALLRRLEAERHEPADPFVSEEVQKLKEIEDRKEWWRSRMEGPSELRAAFAEVQNAFKMYIHDEDGLVSKSDMVRGVSFTQSDEYASLRRSVQTELQERAQAQAVRDARYGAIPVKKADAQPQAWSAVGVQAPASASTTSPQPKPATPEAFPNSAALPPPQDNDPLMSAREAAEDFKIEYTGIFNRPPPSGLAPDPFSAVAGLPAEPSPRRALSGGSSDGSGSFSFAGFSPSAFLRESRRQQRSPRHHQREGLPKGSAQQPLPLSAFCLSAHYLDVDEVKQIVEEEDRRYHEQRRVGDAVRGPQAAWFADALGRPLTDETRKRELRRLDDKLGTSSFVAALSLPNVSIVSSASDTEDIELPKPRTAPFAPLASREAHHWQPPTLGSNTKVNVALPPRASQPAAVAAQEIHSPSSADPAPMQPSEPDMCVLCGLDKRTSPRCAASGRPHRIGGLFAKSAIPIEPRRQQPFEEPSQRTTRSLVSPLPPLDGLNSSVDHTRISHSINAFNDSSIASKISRQDVAPTAARSGDGRIGGLVQELQRSPLRTIRERRS